MCKYANSLRFFGNPPCGDRISNNIFFPLILANFGKHTFFVLETGKLLYVVSIQKLKR